jgi:hypothetical protein
MHCIKNSCIYTSTPFNKTIASLSCIAAMTAVALSIIGLKTESSGSFNGIVQFGATTHGILLGTSLFVLTLNFAWIVALCKKTKESSVSQPEFSKCESPQSALVPANEEIEENDYLSQLSEEMILKVFDYLNPIELARCGEVSKRWTRLASDSILWNAFDIKEVFPSLKVFDEKDWERFFGLEIQDASPLDKRKNIPILKKFLSLTIEENAGATLLTIPKDLTFNTLIQRAESPKEENTLRLRYIWNRISEEFGDIPVNQTYRIVMANNVFTKSRNLPIRAQKDLVNKIDCKMPSVLEATALIITTFMSTGECLYHDHPWTYTLCSEQIDGYQLLVGGLYSAGLFIGYKTMYNLGEKGIIGVGGALRDL